MIRLARWMGRSAFAGGLVVGLVLNLGLIPMAVARATPPCPDVTSSEPDAQPFVDLQCQVHAALFADESEAGAAFNFGTTDITSPGKYDGTDWRGEPVRFEVAEVISLNLAEHEPALHEQGVVARLAFGRLVGPAGDVPVRALSVFLNEFTEDNQFLVIVTATMTELELARHEEVSRIRAGVRVLDVGTFQSRPLSGVTSASTMAASGGDLSSLLGTNVNAAGPGGVDPACVQLAYDQHQIALDAASATAALCCAGVVAVFAVLMAVCVSMSLGSAPASVIVIIVCSLSALAELSIGLAGCTANYAIVAHAARQSLLASLRACGVVIAEA